MGSQSQPEGLHYMGKDELEMFAHMSKVERFMRHIPGGNFLFDVIHPRVIDSMDDIYVDMGDF